MIRRLSLLAALLPFIGQAEAQVPDRIVTGVVFDSVSGEPVGSANLYFFGRRDEFSTDSYGRFRITGVHRHDSVLVVRRIGYVPAHVAVPYAADQLAVNLGAVRVRAAATRLDQIEVEAEEVTRYPHLEDFYRRKQAGRPGAFITREDIARTGARKTTEMLARTTKIEMDCFTQQLGSDQCIARSRRGRQIQRMFSDAAMQRRRAQGVVDEQDTTGTYASMDRCQMEVWIDGVRSTLGADEVPLSWIAAIEVYTGLAQTPAAFGHGQCGVIAIWTTRAGG